MPGYLVNLEQFLAADSPIGNSVKQRFERGVNAFVQKIQDLPVRICCLPRSNRSISGWWNSEPEPDRLKSGVKTCFLLSSKKFESPQKSEFAAYWWWRY